MNKKLIPQEIKEAWFKNLMKWKNCINKDHMFSI